MKKTEVKTQRISYEALDGFADFRRAQFNEVISYLQASAAS